MVDKLGVFSFFTGAGFLDLGFEMSGSYDVLFANEYHKPFADVYSYSRSKLDIDEPKYGVQVGDITSNLSNKGYSELDSNIKNARKFYKYIGFVGGPPCPDFSVAGKNRGSNGENGKLSKTYIDLICKSKPDFFLFENVKGLYRTAKHRQFFEGLKLQLVNEGYYLTEKLINALEFGVPQYRERIILIGFKREMLKENGFLVNCSPIIKNFNWYFSSNFDAKEVLSYSWPTQEKFEADNIKPSPLNIPIELTVEYWFKKNNVSNHPNAEHYFKPRAGLEKFQTIPEGDDLKKSYKRLHRWRYSPTAAYGNNEVHLHPYKERRISVAEALAIQSLPQGFVLPENISLTDMFKTIGNGVPYLAAKGLAHNIYSFIYDNPIKDLKMTYAETYCK